MNNLSQAAVFSYSQLAAVAHQLDQLELKYLAQSDKNDGSLDYNNKDYRERLKMGSQNVDGAGNYSIQVLKSALQQEYGLTLPHYSQQDLLDGSQDITDFQGFLCHKSDHWFAIRKIGGRFWNLNSMSDIPVPISHFKLATEMQAWGSQGYTIFCVPTGLPAGGAKPPKGSVTNSATSHWHKMSDLLRGQSTQKDPWENVGSGMRLDGASTATSAAPSSANDFTTASTVSGLSEEEQLQLALQASLEPTVPAQFSAPSMTRVVSESLPPVPPEPAAGQAGSVRIQFKLPSSRCVRRFLLTDPVLAVYAFCQEREQKNIELIYGFPPTDLAAQQHETIGSASLGGQSLTGRFV
jgi:ataxin-3